MHDAARAAVVALVLAACRGKPPAEVVIHDTPVALSSAAEPEVAASPDPPQGAALADPPGAAVETPPPAKLAAADGAALRPAYRGCLGDFAVGEVAGEAYILYGYGATGRVDRLAADGSVAEAYDLPIGASVLRYASPKGPASGAKVPIAGLRAIGGLGPRKLFVVAELNVANENWDDTLFELRGRKWREAAGSGSALYPRGDAGVLGYEDSEEERDVSYFSAVTGPIRAPDLEVILEKAHAAGAGEDTLDEIFGPPGIDVYDYAVARHGPILALVRYHDRLGSEATPVGSWLMVWGSDGALAGVERVRETFELGDDQVVAGDDAGYVLGKGALRRWRAGAFENLPRPELVGASEACLYLIGVDPERRLWVGCDREIARLEGETWIRETLPSDAEAVAGVEAGALWIRAGDDSLWSRAADGTWTRHSVPVDAPAVADTSGSYVRLKVTSDGAAWAVREFIHSNEMTAAGQLLSTSFVYTSRPLDKPNPCRGVDPERPAEPSRPVIQ